MARMHHPQPRPTSSALKHRREPRRVLARGQRIGTLLSSAGMDVDERKVETNLEIKLEIFFCFNHSIKFVTAERLT
jgi:hypothetical protein